MLAVAAALLVLMARGGGAAQAQGACGGFNAVGFQGGFQGGFQAGFQGGFNFGQGGFQSGFNVGGASGFQGFNFGLSGFGFNFGGSRGCATGIFGLVPDAQTVGAGDPFSLGLIWISPTRSSDLERLEIRLRDGDRVVATIRWTEGTDVFSLVDGASGAVVGGGTSRTARTVETSGVVLQLGSSFSENSGPNGQAVGISVGLRLRESLAGRRLVAEVSAKADGETATAFESAAVVNLAATQTDDDDDDGGRRPTEEQRQQRARSNRAGLDEYRTEGNAVEASCVGDPASITIANRDGQVVLRLHHDARDSCALVRAGDYVEAVGEKQHEQLYDVDQLVVRRGGARVR